LKEKGNDMKDSEVKDYIKKINNLFCSGHPDAAIELLKTLDNSEIDNGIETPFTHDIPLKNESDIWGTSIIVEPSCAFNNIVLDDLIDEIANFKEPFLTYFQYGSSGSYRLHFVKWNGKNLYHVSLMGLDFLDGVVEDGSDEYFDIIKNLDNGYLDTEFFPKHEWYHIIK
jgi:hypothetical protein